MSNQLVNIPVGGKPLIAATIAYLTRKGQQ